MGKIVSIDEIINVNDPDALVKMVERAQKNSVGAKKTVRNAKRFFVEMKEIKRLLVAIVVSCALSLGSVTVVNAANFVNNLDKISTKDVTEEIVSMLYGSGEEILHGAHYSGIVSKNTVFNRNSGSSNYFYNHEGIAKDLLKLDGDSFDYAFYSVCDDMGKNINNLVGVGGRSNIDSVIYYLSLYSNVEGSSFNEYVQSQFSDVSSLNDYLIKNNYVDKNGVPSLEAFRKSCDIKAPEVLTSIIEKSDSKGTSKS